MRLLADAERLDAAEDAPYGPDRRGDELPGELARREGRQLITRQAIRRGNFTFVKDLIAAIEVSIDGWNQRCEPFVWDPQDRRRNPRQSQAQSRDFKH